MRKTYRNQLPKGMEVDCTMVRVENGQVVVDVEFKEKFQPKFGDVVRIEHRDITKFKRNYVLAIYPDKKMPTKDENDFFDIASIGMNGNIRVDDASASYKHGFVFMASEAEKKELYDKLAEVGKRWNEKTKRLENIKWTPNNGEAFYYVDVRGEVKAVTRTPFINFLEEYPNCFKTTEAAQKVANQIKEIFKNSKAE